jgi:hypothetical protein
MSIEGTQVELKKDRVGGGGPVARYLLSFASKAHMLHQLKCKSAAEASANGAAAAAGSANGGAAPAASAAAANERREESIYEKIPKFLTRTEVGPSTPHPRPRPRPPRHP